MPDKIPFNWPHMAADTEHFVSQAIASNRCNQGDGDHTARATELLSKYLHSKFIQIVTSCSSALDMAAILCELGPGDEVILPNYTFTSTANSVALRGATPVFVDVDRRDLNISPQAVEQAISSKTKAIVVVHYGGIPADIETLRAICDSYSLKLIEDAAQAIGVDTAFGSAGTLGDFGCLSFHATKNIQCGEGGLLVCKSGDDFKRAEMLREKGTDRSAFIRGEIDKYSWKDLGSSWLPADYVSAYLEAQIVDIESVNAGRVSLWKFLRENTIEHAERIGFRIIGQETGENGNGHIFAYVSKSADQKRKFITHMREVGIETVPHYVALHSSRAGVRFGEGRGTLNNSVEASEKLVRIPMNEIAQQQRERVLDAILSFDG